MLRAVCCSGLAAGGCTQPVCAPARAPPAPARSPGPALTVRSASKSDSSVCSAARARSSASVATSTGRTCAPRGRAGERRRARPRHTLVTPLRRPRPCCILGLRRARDARSMRGRVCAGRRAAAAPGLVGYPRGISQAPHRTRRARRAGWAAAGMSAGARARARLAGLLADHLADRLPFALHLRDLRPHLVQAAWRRAAGL
jgi:hypothetical protein